MVRTVNLRVHGQGRLWGGSYAKRTVAADGLSLILRVPPTVGSKSSEPLESLAFTHGGDDAYLVDRRGRVFEISLRSNIFKYIKTVRGCNGPIVHSKGVSPSLIVPQRDNSITMFDIGKNGKEGTFHPVKGGKVVLINEIISQGCVIVCTDEELSLWRTNTQENLARANMTDTNHRIHDACVLELRSDQKEIVVCTGERDTVDVMRVNDMKPLCTVRFPKSDVPFHGTCCTVSKNFEDIFIGSKFSNRIQWVDGQRLDYKKTLEIPRDDSKGIASLTCTTWSDRDVYLIFSLDVSGNLTGMVFNTSTEELTAICEVENSKYSRKARRIYVSEKNDILVLLMEDGTALLYDISVLIEDFNKRPSELSPFSISRMTKKTKNWVTMEDLDGSDKAEKPPNYNFRHLTVRDPQTMEDGSILRNRKNLERVLREFGQFPPKYRSLAWRFLLRLPENKRTFEILSKKGKKKGHSKPEEKIIAELSVYSPIFAHVQWLENLVKPVVHIFGGRGAERLHLFETVLALLHYYCHDWLSCHPLPPYPLLEKMKDVLAWADPKLWHYLSENFGVRCVHEDCLWPILQGFFQFGVLSIPDWAFVMDHAVVVGTRAFLLYAFPIAFIQTFRSTFLACKTVDQIKSFFSHEHPVDIRELVAHTYKIYRDLENGDICSPDDFHPFSAPLSSSQYPPFSVTSSTKYVVQHQDMVHDRIQQEQEMWKKRNAELAEMKKMYRERERRAKDRKLASERQGEAKAYVVEHGVMRMNEVAEMRLVQQDRWRKERMDKLRNYQKLEESEVKGMNDALYHQSELVAKEYEDLLKRMREDAKFWEENEKLNSLESEAVKRDADLAVQSETDSVQNDLARLHTLRMRMREMEKEKREEIWKEQDEKRSKKRDFERERLQRTGEMKMAARAKRDLEFKMSVADHQLDLDIQKIEHQRNLNVISEEAADEMKHLVLGEKENERIRCMDELQQIKDQYEREMKHINDELLQYDDMWHTTKTKCEITTNELEGKRERREQSVRVRKFANEMSRSVQTKRQELFEAEQKVKEAIASLENATARAIKRESETTRGRRPYVKELQDELRKAQQELDGMVRREPTVEKDVESMIESELEPRFQEFTSHERMGASTAEDVAFARRKADLVRQELMKHLDAQSFDDTSSTMLTDDILKSTRKVFFDNREEENDDESSELESKPLPPLNEEGDISEDDNDGNMTGSMTNVRNRAKEALQQYLRSRQELEVALGKSKEVV